MKAAAALFLIIAIHVLLMGGEASAAANMPPPVDVSMQPEENGRLVYLPIASGNAQMNQSHLFGLSLSITNNATNDVRLTGIQISFTYPDNAVSAFQFTRDELISGTSAKTVYLNSDEGIQLSDPAPASVWISLFFDGYSSKTLQRLLAPYESPAPGGKYLFPGNASDLGPDDYFSHVDPHTGGSQFFGYDFHVQGWNGNRFSSIKAGGDSGNNEDHVTWNVPIYSMADGVVIKALNGYEDNPAPGKRAIQRLADRTDDAIADVKVTQLAADRAATAVRLPSGQLKITVWDLEDNGREIVEKGSAPGEVVEEIATGALTESRLVTAVRLPGGNLRVIVWDVSTDGMTVTRLGESDASGVQEVSLVTLTSSRFVTAVRTGQGELRVIVWSVSTSGLTVSSLSEEFAGTASSISVASLSSSRIATALRDSNSRLKVIVWDVLDSGLTLDRLGEVTADLITKAGAAKVSGNQVAAAMRTAGGNLKVIQWNISADGETLTFEREVTAGQIQDLAAPVGTSLSGSDNIFTAIITQDGNYKNILWRQPDLEKDEDPALLIRFGEEKAGPADRLSVGALKPELFFSGVRTDSGELKVTTWWIGSGGGNCLVILHGNCRVLYAHFKEGTMDPAVAYAGARVVAGQRLARMGNSGRSSGPHCHIHAERVPSNLTVEDVIELESQDALPLVGFRPIPFHCARAMWRNGLKPGGESANALSTLTGQGLYFGNFAIRPAWLKEMYVDWTADCFAPTGEKNCIPAGPLGFGGPIGGPYPTVNQALNDSCWGYELFIRAGSYNESATFNRSMIVRSYDGTAIVGE